MADGAVIGGFTDHHVHLQLVDADRLAGGPLGRVVDLGAAVDAIRERAEHDAERGDRPHVAYAGAFLTPPGGYPSDRSWAPAGSVREIADDVEAESAVVEMSEAGAAMIKIASNREAGPVFDDRRIRRIVRIADAHGLPVVAHAEGAGEAARMPSLGVRALAHTPFSERLDDAAIAAHAGSVAWISTLAIHDGAARGIAIDNLRRFHAAGGTVRYGTDMGNGDLPVGLHPGELDALREAGIAGAALLRALAPVPATRARRFVLADPAAPLSLTPLPPAMEPSTRPEESAHPEEEGRR